MSAILMTGASSVSSGIARELVEHGSKVVFYDIIGQPWIERIDFIQDEAGNITFEKGDVLDFRSLVNVCREHEIKGIIHTARVRQKGISFRDEGFKNVQMTENCLEVARLLDLSFVYTSSIATYGTAVSSGEVPITKSLTENDTANKFPMAPPGPYDHPMAWYVCTKRIGEELTSYHYQDYGMNACAFRLGSVYGPGDKKLHFINILVRLALAGKPLEIPHGGDHPENLTYSPDLGRVAVKVLHKRPPSHLYNITGVGARTSNYLTIEQQAEIVARTIKGARFKIGSGMIPHGFHGISYIRPPVSSERAEKEIDYEITPFEKGINKTADWISKNWSIVPSGYDELPSSWKVT